MTQRTTSPRACTARKLLRRFDRPIRHWVQVAETRDLDEDTVLDRDADGNICAITVEHASKRAGIPKFSYEQVTS